MPPCVFQPASVDLTWSTLLQWNAPLADTSGLGNGFLRIKADSGTVMRYTVVYRRVWYRTLPAPKSLGQPGRNGLMADGETNTTHIKHLLQ